MERKLNSHLMSLWGAMNPNINLRKTSLTQKIKQEWEQKCVYIMEENILRNIKTRFCHYMDVMKINSYVHSSFKFV
jgi:hypothetical protein